jgi:hypothetical protein
MPYSCFAICICYRVYLIKYIFSCSQNNILQSDQATHKIIFFKSDQATWPIRKNNNNIYFQMELLNPYMILATNAIVTWHVLPLCNALPIVYQRICKGCITYLQRPKTQHILNSLVNVLATLILTFRYRSMHCCRGVPIVVWSSWHLHALLAFFILSIAQL